MGISNADLVQQADAVAAGIIRHLENLPASEWQKPSACEGWSVADLAAHLVLVEGLLSSSINRGFKGDSGPPPEAPGGLADWRAYRTREIARLRQLPPAELVSQFRAGLETMREPLAKVSGPQAPAGKGWHTWQAQPLDWFPGQWLVELTLHDWDIRVASDPNAQINPAALPGLGPQMRSRMTRCIHPDQAGELSGVIKIDLDGTSPVSWVARASNGSIEVLENGQGTADATIHSDPATYALVQTGRRTASVAAANGSWRVTGDTALAERLAKAFAGY